MYLLEETPEAQEMRDNVLNLLLSFEESNATLACQIIMGGGVHKDFIGLICAYTLEEYWNYAEETPYNNLLKLFFSKKEMRSFYRFSQNHYGWETFIDTLSKKVEKKVDFFLLPYWKDLALFAFERQGACGSICLKHHIVPAKTIFERLSYSSWLNLSNFGLDDLPDGFEDLKVSFLNITGNPFRYIKRKNWRNYHITQIDYDKTLSQNVLKILGACFPKIIPDIHTHQSTTCIGFLKNTPKEKRDIKFYKVCAETYKNDKNYG